MPHSSSARNNNKRPLDFSLSSDSQSPKPNNSKKRKKRSRNKMTSSNDIQTRSQSSIINLDNTSNKTITPKSQENRNLHYENNFIATENPDLSDLMNGIALIINKLDKIQSDLASSNKRIDKNECDIAIINEKVAKNDTDIVKIKGSINMLNQQKISDEVVLKGFPLELDTEDVTKVVSNMCSLFNINPSRVSKYYSFANHSKIKIMSTIVIKFLDNDDPINLISQIIAKGPPTLSQLINTTDPSQDDIIRCSSRLTKVNIQINQTLRKLKKENKIHAIKYRNHCYHYQEKPDAIFEPVLTVEEMQEKLLQHLPNELNNV